MALPSSTSRTVSAFLFRRGIPRSSALYCCIPVRIPRCHSLSSHGKENRLEDFFVSLKRDTASLCNCNSPFIAQGQRRSPSTSWLRVVRHFDLWAGCRRAICKHDGSHAACAAEPEVLGWSDFYDLWVSIYGSQRETTTSTDGGVKLTESELSGLAVLFLSP